jgi:glycosidase
MLFEKSPWVLRTNIYEVNLRQYTEAGTFAAFREHMPRLKDMGVHILWFMPITPISKWKRKGTMGSYYASADYLTINPEFGTLQEFRELVMYAHELGMKLIIDWVANHTGADHSWTTSNPDYFIRNDEGQFYDKHGWDDVIDLDYTHAGMRIEMIRCMEFWVRECNIDGFRCDMAMLVPLDFWVEARAYLDKGKKLFWLAECDQWNDPDYLRVFDAAYTWKWMHAAHEYLLHHKPIGTLKDILHGYQLLQPGDSLKAWFTSNHDENSWNGTEYEKYGGLAVPLAVFSCLWNGIPLLYSGQELPNHKRLAFFEKDAIEWTHKPKLHELYRTLLTLRFEHEALIAGSAGGSTEYLNTDHADKVFAFVRKLGSSEVVVMLNFSEWPLDVKLYNNMDLAGYTEIFSVQTLSSSFPYTVLLPGWGFAVWAK